MSDPDFKPTRFAVIADAHGNADALAAVLADIDAQNVGQILNLGDHVSGPLAPGETAALTLARGMISVRGNHDRWALGLGPEPAGFSDRLAFEEMDEAQRAWLGALPATRQVGDVFMCHGAPADDLTYWLERPVQRPGEAIGITVPRDLAEVSRLAEGVEAGLMLCAHSHVARRVDLPDGRVVVNPGSVGCPGYVDPDDAIPHRVQTGSPAACYAILERRDAGWDVTFRSIPYDAARMVARARALGREDWARVVGTGWVEQP